MKRKMIPVFFLTAVISVMTAGCQTKVSAGTGEGNSYAEQQETMQTSVQNNTEDIVGAAQEVTEVFTEDTTVQEVIDDPAFAGFGRLLFFCRSIQMGYALQ